MILTDKTSGIQLVTFLSTKFSKILHKVHYRYTSFSCIVCGRIWDCWGMARWFFM